LRDLRRQRAAAPFELCQQLERSIAQALE